MPGGGREIYYLAEGVGAGVGGGWRRGMRMRSPVNRVRPFQRPLDRRLVKLQLESVIVGALVFDP